MAPSKRAASWTNLDTLSPTSIAFLALLLVLYLHTAGLFIFVKGFLLSRVALSQISNTDAPLPARFNRAVILLIDALRYDFVFPAENGTHTHYDNVLTLPAQLTLQHPQHSALFKFVADPPTTTLQRLKALTVGTLPTFVDAGSNFAGTNIEEDNWVVQAQRAGKRVAFAGDDTWTLLFPAATTQADAVGALDPNMTWPYDSFNVEDLDTVDDGVRTHLLPLLESGAPDWDIAIGHMLGVDHVGHRLRPNHFEMTRKLTEANDLLRKVVDNLRPDDLLVLMGDHGMDRDGNHGGDTEDETNAALWLYSRKPLLASTSSTSALLKALPSLQPYDSLGRRSVSQISFVPTFSLLMGLPLPFSNLGSVIPDLFEKKELEIATKANLAQIQNFLTAYLGEGADDNFRTKTQMLSIQYEKMPDTIQARFEHMQDVLSATRAVWATFNPVWMSLGLLVLLSSVGLLARFAILSSIDGALFRQARLRLIIGQSLAGLIIGSLCGFTAAFFLQLPVTLTTLSMGSLSSLCGAFWLNSATPSTTSKFSLQSLAYLIPILHGFSFASNSFILWEDYMVVYMCQACILLRLCKALTSPNARLRRRVTYFGSAALILVRLVGLSTICREEQQPHCIATFHLPNTITFYPIFILVCTFIASIITPSIFARILDLTQSRQGISGYFLGVGLRTCLVGAWAYWALDWFTAVWSLSPLIQATMATAKNVLALSLYANAIAGVAIIWHFLSDLNIDIRRKEETAEGSKHVKIELLGHANCLGSTYLIFFSGVLALLAVTNRPVGQLALYAITLALISYLEANDSVKDSEAALRQLAATAAGQTIVLPADLGVSMIDVSVLALAGFAGFFATGHQAVLSSIQWKIAFVGFSKVTYPFSPVLVGLNTVGAFVLTALAVPLAVFWNVGPPIRNGPSQPLIRHLFRACVLFMLYHSLVAFPSALFAAWHRRHLMVWKVFAPRFMLSMLTLVTVDVTIVFGAFLWAGTTVLKKSARTLGSHWS